MNRCLAGWLYMLAVGAALVVLLLAPLWNQLVIACEFGCRRWYVKAAFAPDYDSSHVLLT